MLGGGKQYQLSSMYAESEDDTLLFEKSKTGMQLLDTPFVGTLDESTTGYLTKFHSIPGFLGAVTMELLSRSTVA